VDNSTFVVLLARQRSGTTALRSILGTHPDVFCLPEVFNLPDRHSDDPLTRRSNFFNFLVDYSGGDVTRTFPDQHAQLFTDYLSYLRSLTEKRFVVIDVKYNTAHLLTSPYAGRHPVLFDLIRANGLRVLQLTRKNHLRVALSLLKAEGSGRWSWSEWDASAYQDRSIRVNVPKLLQMFADFELEDEYVRRLFADYEGFDSCEYTEVYSALSGGATEGFLRRFAAWLGIEETFSNSTQYRKQATLSLRQSVLNYDEVAAALATTPFEYCLRDEFAIDLEESHCQSAGERS
jgi:hypothetical protein